jgi:hypothetical protein
MSVNIYNLLIDVIFFVPPIFQRYISLIILHIKNYSLIADCRWGKIVCKLVACTMFSELIPCNEMSRNLYFIHRVMTNNLILKKPNNVFFSASIRCTSKFDGSKTFSSITFILPTYLLCVVYQLGSKQTPGRSFRYHSVTVGILREMLG